MDDTHVPADLAAQLAGLFAQQAQTDYKSLTLYFAPNEHLADSWVRANRKAGGFMGLGNPAPGASIESLDVAITLRPNVLDQTGSWLGFTFTITDVMAAAPGVQTLRAWTETTADVDVPAGTLARLEPWLREMVRQPVATTEPPREAPESMY
jgi:hypothetical protein